MILFLAGSPVSWSTGCVPTIEGLIHIGYGVTDTTLEEVLPIGSTNLLHC